MLGSPESFLSELWRPPDRIIQPDEDQTSFYMPWGFTIYRTCYNPDSEEQWRILINEIEMEIEDVIIPEAERDNLSPAIRHILSLLHLDFRSDAAALDGLDIDQLRQVYMNSVGGESMNRHNRNYMVFLVADDEVLSNQPATVYRHGSLGFHDIVDHGCSISQVRWLKCVQPDYVAANHIPRSGRYVGPRYFGWFRIGTRDIEKLWEDLGTFEIDRIALRTKLL